MATGRHAAVATADSGELPEGAVVTSSGRVSAAEVFTDERPAEPFGTVQLARLDDALTLASRDTGLRFAIYLGELGSRPQQKASELLGSLDDPAEAVLVAVSPGERAVEVVTGAEAAQRLSDRGAKLAVMSMVASFKESDLLGGLLSGLRMLADQAGPRHG